MHHRTLDQINQVATVQPAPNLTWNAIRRQRLHRLADLLSAYTGPIRLLTRIEYLPSAERQMLRGDFSPLALAYQNAEFRRAGLAGDTLGDAMAFFDLSDHESHALFCDCHYGCSVEAPMIAARIRIVANRSSFRERWQNVRAFLFSR
jgi:hypothetical protein